MIIPNLKANYIRVPEAFLDFLIVQGLSRNELLVCLFLVKKTFGSGLHGLLTAEEVSSGSKMELRAAQEALDRGVDRQILLRFEILDEGGASGLYALHTEEHHVLAGYEVPLPRSPAPSLAEASPPLPEASAETSLVKKHLHELLGRDLARDEEDRLSDFCATDAEIREAIDSLRSRNTRFYSSDQVLYELDAMRSRKREQVHAESMKKTRGARGCSKCSGLGYLFIGEKSLKKCECNKG